MIFPRPLRFLAWLFLMVGDVVMYPFMWIARPDGARTLRPSGGCYGDPPLRCPLLPGG